VAESITIQHRFNGPLDNGQGGYSAGMVARFVDGPAEVSLRRPVPLDAPLEIARNADGAVRALAGDALVAEGRPAPGFAIDVPAPVSAEDAREATGRYLGEGDGPFSRCFVCGRARDDGFHVFAGEVAGRRMMVSPWTPPDWTADAHGNVRPEFVWATLDCPASFATLLDDGVSMGVLARLTARLDAPVLAGREHIVMGWPLGAEGRKANAGAAVLAADGTVLAAAQALLVTPRGPSR
jgi:hypothetical protein